MTKQDYKNEPTNAEKAQHAIDMERRGRQIDNAIATVCGCCLVGVIAWLSSIHLFS